MASSNADAFLDETGEVLLVRKRPPSGQEFTQTSGPPLNPDAGRMSEDFDANKGSSTSFKRMMTEPHAKRADVTDTRFQSIDAVLAAHPSASSEGDKSGRRSREQSLSDNSVGFEREDGQRWWILC